MTNTPSLSPRWQLMLRNHRLRLIGSAFGLVVIAVLAIVMLQRVSAAQLIAAIQTAQPNWLAASTLPFAGGQILRVLRTRRVLAKHMPVSLSTSAHAVLFGQVINWLSPIRVGDLWRINRTLENHPERLAWAIAGVVIEKSADALVLAAFAIIVTVSPLPVAFASPLSRLLMTGLGGMLLATALTALTSSRAQQKITRRLPKAAGLLRFAADAEHPQALIPASALRSTWVDALPVTLLIWVCAVTANYMLARAFGIEIGLVGHLLLMLAIQTSTVFSPVPGNVGVLSLVALGVLSPLGVAPATAIAFGAVLWLLSYGVLAVLTLIASVARGVRTPAHA